MNQGSGNEELLNTARDYFHFVTKFFEPISVSATHIYHSALELSPLSSIVRRLYYQQRYASSPRVIVGNQDSWDQQLVTSCKYDRSLCTWSPCGRFIAVGDRDGVEIRDSLSFELLSTLMPTRPGRGLIGQLSYSMDGRSVASTFGTLLVIWDIQTGGVAKEIEYGGFYNVALAWSLNGSTIGIIPLHDLDARDYTVYIYNVASGTIHSPGTLLSTDVPRLLADDTSFRVMATARDDDGCIVNVFEAGPVLTKIESFRIRLRETDLRVESFSQTSHRISVSAGQDYFVFDLRTSRCLLSAKHLGSHCFSSNGSLFAGISTSALRIWKYTSDGYTWWRNFPCWGLPTSDHFLQFSPTSSSLLIRSDYILRLWRLDGPPIVAHPGRRMPLIALSHCGSYMAAGNESGSIVTITNLVSQTPPHSVDTGMTMDLLVLTGNVLLVSDFTTIAAWRLTEEGKMHGVFIDRRAGRGDSIWIVPLPGSRSDELSFSLGDQTVAIRRNKKVVHVYRTETGEVLEPTQILLYHRNYSPWDVLRGLHYLRRCSSDPVLWDSMKKGWVEDLKGKHRLWISAEWRGCLYKAISSEDRETLRFDLGGEIILIKF